MFGRFRHCRSGKPPFALNRLRGKATAAAFDCALLAGAAWLAASPLSAANANDVGKAELLAAACTGCHGPDAGGALRVPGLLTLNAGEIRDAIEAFANGEEPQTVMRRIALAYTEEEIRLISEYLGVLE